MKGRTKSQAKIRALEAYLDGVKAAATATHDGDWDQATVHLLAAISNQMILNTFAIEDGFAQLSAALAPPKILRPH